MQSEKEGKAMIQDVRVLDKTWLTEDTFMLRIERKKLTFRPGQYIVLHLDGESREYSICSGPDDGYLDILIKLVKNGVFTPRLRALVKEDMVGVEGPYGFFLLRADEISHYRYYFIATGTGISPFLSFLNFYPGLNYTLLHGVRTKAEASWYKQISQKRKVICTSRSDTGDFHGRLTRYIQANPIVYPESIYYLCGNSAMIEEVTEYLESHDVDPFFIRQEVFF